MTYSERSQELAANASVAVLALSNPEGTDLEFIPLRPYPMSACDREELAARWSGRNLRSIGVIGLVGASPRCALKEPLEPEQISAIARAFLAYLHVLLADSFAEQLEQAEIHELRRMWSLTDTRMAS